MEEIINKVAQSGLINIDLEDYYTKGPRLIIDIKDHLFMGQILKEKDFRAFISSHNWAQYKDAFVAVFCSTDAVIPSWAFMLIAARLQPYARHITCGSLENLETELFRDVIMQIDVGPFKDKRLIIKGCGKLPVPPSAFMMITEKLTPVAHSIMFGEACSTVPVFKQARTESEESFSS